MVRQTMLPLRMGGTGLRSALRTSTAAYWGSWADAMPEIIQRFPDIGNQILHRLTVLHAATPVDTPGGPACIQSAEQGGRLSELAGWTDRPS